MVEVKAKDKEALDSLLRRFKRRMQMSRDQIRARKLRFYEPPKNKRKQKEDAIRRSQLRADRDLLNRTSAKANLYSKTRKY